MVEREKPNEVDSKMEAAITAIDAHSQYIGSRYGTETEAGSELSLWKPYHTVERELVLKVLPRLFTTAIAKKNDPSLDISTRKMFENLRQGDLPAILMAASFMYPSFEDLDTASPSLAKKKMEEAGVFSQRDFAIVSAVIEAVIVKESHDAPVKASSVDPQSIFAAHEMLFSDSFRVVIKGLAESMYLISLLGIERLVENNAIRTKDGKLPKNLDEVISDGTTYSDDVLCSDIRRIDQDLFSAESTFNPRLAITTERFPYFASNREYFYNTLMPQGREKIDLPRMLRTTRQFALDFKN